MKHSEIRRLNRMFGEAFGYTSASGPKYQWLQGSDHRLFYFIDRGMKEVQTPGGIILMQRVYERATWAKRLGANTWVICQWTPPPMSEEVWADQFKGKFEYPANGRFAPITNTKLDAGQYPDEDITRYAIAMIFAQLGKTAAQFYAESVAEAEKDQRAAQAEWAEKVDDFWPAFDNVPGQKLHTSFPTVNPISKGASVVCP